MRPRTLFLALLALALVIPEGASAARIVVKREPGLNAAERAQIRADAGVRLLERPGLERTEVVSAPAGETQQALRELRADPDVEYAVLDRPVHALSNDPYFADLWGLQELSDHDIDAPEAWAATIGAGITVAVADSGVEATHPDLLGHVTGGHDFVEDDTVAQDEDGHGTHVSGTIAATRDNAIGITGVAPGAAIYPLRVLDENGSGDGIDAADAFDMAGELGIRVVNASFGAEGFYFPEYDAIAQNPSTLYIVAAGNGGPDHVGDDNDGAAPDYPCSYDLANIICVGASDDEDDAASFSNYGATSVDLFAPGVGIWSTVFGSYQWWHGTSMAAPHVTGIAALLLARNPTLSTAQLKSAILNGADPVAGLAGLSVTGARANANGAVARVAPNTPPPPATDSDGDGVVDTSDACPSQAGPAPTGCPATTPPPADGGTTNLDSDGDGRSDASDGCPKERAKTADGCPIPAFSSLSKSVSSCRTGKRCTRSVRLSVRTDRAATVRVKVERKRCKNGKRCRWVRAGSKSATATKGKTARLTVKPLQRGAHRAIVKLTSSAGTSKPRTLSFKVR